MCSLVVGFVKDSSVYLTNGLKAPEGASKKKQWSDDLMSRMKSLCY